MKPVDQDFIRQNHHKLSSRQIAKKLDIERSEVEKYIQSLGTQKITVVPVAIPKKSLWLIAAIIFSVGFLLRLLYIHQLRSTPFFEPLSTKLDDGVYRSIAQAILGGNFWADVPFSAYRMPLYPYFLAGIYKVFGSGVDAVHYIQSLVGCFSAVVAFFIAKEIFKDLRVAMITGVTMAIYIPFIFFENMLLGESLSIFLNLAALLLVIQAMNEKGKVLPRLPAAGFIFGLSLLLRPNAIIAVLAVSFGIGFMHWKKKKPNQRIYVLPVVLLLFMVLAVTPSVIRNYKLQKDFVPFSALGGINLYIGNNESADGKFTLVKGIGTSLDTMLENSIQIAEKVEKRSLKPSEVSSFWSGEARKFILGSPFQAAQLFFVKASYFLNQYEFPDILDIYFASQFLPFLKMHGFLYGIVVIFAVFGLFTIWRERRWEALPVVLFFLGYTASVVLFFVTSRYRLPAVPMLILFAAFGANELWTAISVKKKMPLSFFIVCLISMVVVFKPVEATNFTTNYNSLAISLKNKGDFESAEKYYLKAIEIAPAYPSPYYNLSLLLREDGRDDEADSYLEKYENALGALEASR